VITKLWQQSVVRLGTVGASAVHYISERDENEPLSVEKAEEDRGVLRSTDRAGFGEGSASSWPASARGDRDSMGTTTLLGRPFRL
jgi:hypothetical protein